MSLPLRAPLGQTRFAGGHVAWLSGTTQTILVGMLFEAPATGGTAFNGSATLGVGAAAVAGGGLGLQGGSVLGVAAAIPTGGGGTQTLITEDFNTDPASRWTVLWDYTLAWTSSTYLYGMGAWRSNTAVGTGDVWAKMMCQNGAGGIAFRAPSGTGYYDSLVTWSGGSWTLSTYNESGWVTDTGSGSLAFTSNDVMAVTCSGHEDGVNHATYRIWKNPANATPYDVANWDSASDPPDVTISSSGQTYPPSSSNTYVGIAFDGYEGYDDFSAGNFAADGLLGTLGLFGTGTLATVATTTANGLLGLFGAAALAVANAVTSGAEWFGADLPAWMWRVYQRVRRHPYTRM